MPTVSSRWNSFWNAWPAAALVLVVVLLRVLPHPVNFAPTLALAWNLHRWSSTSSRWTRLGVLLLSCLVGDAVVNSLLYGMDAQQVGAYWSQPGPWVLYGTYGILAILGPWGNRPTWSGTFLRVPMASLLFFVVSNTTVWLWGGMYPANASGWMAAIVAGLPFLTMSLSGDLVYTAIFKRLSPEYASESSSKTLLQKV
ncbi:MAG: DUF6580 family putative transport protein [Bacteroidota bacterium]